MQLNDTQIADFDRDGFFVLFRIYSTGVGIKILAQGRWNARATLCNDYDFLDECITVLTDQRVQAAGTHQQKVVILYFLCSH